MNISSAGYQSASLYQALNSPNDLERFQRPASNPEAISRRPVEQGDEPAGPQGRVTDQKQESSLRPEQREEDDALSKAEERLEKQRVEEERIEVLDLSARDREVRAHEQAHAAVGGQYAGAPQYQFKRGPDGVNYAISGEVSISVSKEATPSETIRKMQIVQRAALAPAEPSPQDRRVAAQAARTMAEAQAELRIQNAEEREAKSVSSEGEDSDDSASVSSASESESSTNDSAAQSRQFAQFTQVVSAIDNASAGLQSGSLLQSFA